MCEAYVLMTICPLRSVESPPKKERENNSQQLRSMLLHGIEVRGRDSQDEQSSTELDRRGRQASLCHKARESVGVQIEQRQPPQNRRLHQHPEDAVALVHLLSKHGLLQWQWRYRKRCMK